ncbi:MAG: peptidoglycan DD-metalloendopeptidase family protein, partial [Muribaculaceae bacterium]|nr:peptidoglycan DD-metalloendopeptidase family protein [Muribaculaceae bacterium]
PPKTISPPPPPALFFYMKEFSDWKDKQTRDINAKVEVLAKETKDLQRVKGDKDVMLNRELKAQAKLSEQKQRQSEVVAGLKANGDALQTHLAKKQSEVNDLKNRVAALIAEEQRKAEEERRKKAEAERVERERREREAAEAAARKAAEEEAARKAAEEKAAREEAARKDETKKEQPKSTTPKKDTSKKEAPKKEAPKKESPKKEQPKKKEEESKTASKGSYAEARKRKPRGESSSKEEAPKKEAPGKSTKSDQPTSGGSFESMRGALPRPVSGAFRVTGKFGRHALPDLPDVTYDNPGIDVEVASGAAVQSVYGGTVSGVYMVPGFSTVVIVSHGDYYTVYGNVGSASVKVGDKVKGGQTLGRLAEDPDNPGHSSLHFEVWKGREKLNPQNWIK